MVAERGQDLLVYHLGFLFAFLTNDFARSLLKLPDELVVDGNFSSTEQISLEIGIQPLSFSFSWFSVSDV